MKIDRAGILHCPNCDGTNMHHEQVDIFIRNKEDSADGLALSAICDYKNVPLEPTGPVVISNTNAEVGNPSERRGALVVKFHCENCDVQYSLAIVQHKGQTRLSSCLSFPYWKRKE